MLWHLLNAYQKSAVLLEALHFFLVFHAVLSELKMDIIL